MRRLKLVIPDSNYKNQVLSRLTKNFKADIIGRLLTMGYNEPIILEGPYSEAFLVNSKQLSIIKDLIAVGKHPYCSGIHIATIFGRVKKRIEYSLAFTELLLKIGLRRSIIVINDWGERLVLYGRDVLAGSIIDIYPPIYKGSNVIIVNRNFEFIGIGKSLYSFKEIMKLRENNPQKVVVKNKRDLGWYLRRGM